MGEKLLKKRSIFWRLSLKHGIWFILFGAITYLSTQIVIYGTDIIANAVDTLSSGNTVDFKEIIPKLLICMLLAMVVTFIEGYSGNIFGVNIIRDFRNEAIKKLVKLEYRYFDEKGSGSIITRLISDIKEIEGFFTGIVYELLYVSITIITVSMYVVRINVKLMLIVLICYPFILFLVNKIAGKMVAMEKNLHIKYDMLSDVTNDIVGGITVARSYNLFQVVKKRFDDTVHEIFSGEIERNKLMTMTGFLHSIINWIPNAVCYIFSVWLVLNGEITTGNLMAFVLLLNRIINPMSDFPFIISEIRLKKVSFDRLNEIMSQPEEQGGERTEAVQGEKIVISMKDICFAYQSERQILHNINIDIKEGSVTAIVGDSGGGKTTLYKLICGFYKPISGIYRLYGDDFDNWEINAARDNCALVSQDVFLYPETIAENVSYGKENASREEIIEACKKANIHEFIEGLPDKYETLVGERGIKLSGGERQRISIARAFLKNAPILLLDEPTSALDIETERLIQGALDRISVNKTVLIIAHRLSTIMNADEILVIHDGTISERGTHDVLLKEKGVYNELYHKQDLLQTEGAELNEE